MSAGFGQALTASSSVDAGSARPGGWLTFLRGFAAVFFGAAALLYAFIAAMDPYGSRAGPGRTPTPLMDLNQRFMYPQVVRSGRYDGAVFGTSTVRLLDPAAIGAAFGARVANLGLNAGTPWEQMQLANLFLDAVPRPSFVLLALDRTWCEPDADQPAKRLTPRAFPPWLYDRDRLNDYAHLFNLRSLEIAGRVALHGLGRMRPRIREDGYEVFTPPEARYDLARARAHIWGDGTRAVQSETPPAEPSPEALGRIAFPALARLDTLLARLPSSTKTLVMFPPVHIAAQPRPNSMDAASDAACKDRIAALASNHRATVLDFRIPSPVTREDANYWDALHYRLPIADSVVVALKAAAETGQDAPDGFYRVLGR